MYHILEFVRAHWVLLSLLCVAIYLCSVLRKPQSQQILSQALMHKINAGQIHLIDIRSPQAYAQKRILSAVLIASNLESLSAYIQSGLSLPCVLVSSNGIDAKIFAQKLANKGISVSVLFGGVDAWGRAQLPFLADKAG